MRVQGVLVILALATIAGRCCADDPPQNPAAAKLATQLVRQLGASSFQDREAASRQLAQLGVAAKAALTAGIKSDDAEVRARCRRLLASVLEAEYEARINAFAADHEGLGEHDLPGWERYRSLIGEDAAARGLFVEMHRSEPDLLQTSRASKRAASELLNRRCQELYESIRNPQGDEPELTTGAVATVLFVGTDAEIDTNDRSMSYLQSLSYQPALRQAFTAGPRTGAIRKLLSAWIERHAENSGAYGGMQVGAYYGLEASLKPALFLVAQPGTQPSMLTYACLNVARFGNREHRPQLAALLKNENVCYRTQRDGKIVEVQVRDVALASLVHLTGQDLEDYGYKNVEPNSRSIYNPSSLAFTEASQRDVALKKWETWAAENK